MARLPKFVQSRLGALPGAEDWPHPDADLLAGFAERTISEAERSQVALHLAGCADCRETLMLAFGDELPAPEAVAPVRGWLAIPFWRVAVPALVACSAFVLIWQTRSQPESAQVVASLRSQARIQDERDARRLYRDDSVVHEPRHRISLPPEKIYMRSPEQETSPHATTQAAAPVASSAANQFMPPVPTTVPSSSRPKDSLASTARAFVIQPMQAFTGVQSQQFGPQQDAGQAAQSLQAVNAPAAPRMRSSGAGVGGGFAGGVPGSTAQNVEVVGSVGAVQTVSVPPPPPPAPRAVMQTVMVQAASDQIVPVESSPPAPPAAAAPLAKKAAKREMATLVLSGRQTAQMSGRSVAPTHWTICADPADRTHGRVCRDSGMLAADPVLIDRRVSFLSVASSGLDVWAGGAKGALFHSSDSGEHWERIAVSETISKSGRRLHGAIVKIDLSTPTRLQILTDRGETWVREGGNWLRRGD